MPAERPRHREPPWNTTCQTGTPSIRGTGMWLIKRTQGSRYRIEHTISATSPTSSDLLIFQLCRLPKMYLNITYYANLHLRMRRYNIIETSEQRTIDYDGAFIHQHRRITGLDLYDSSKPASLSCH